MAVSSLVASRAALGLHRPTAYAVRHHTGYIPFEGRFDLRNNEFTRYVNQRKLINLQPVKRVAFSFDPFRPDVAGIRNVMFAFSYETVRATNPKCAFKTEVRSDGSEPTVRVELNEGDRDIVFKAGKLNAEEVLFHFNRIVLPLVKEVKVAVTETKGSKAAADIKGGGKKGRK